MNSSTKLTTRKILIVVDAPGPAEFIAPVIPQLSARGGSSFGGKTYNLKLVTVGPSPTKILAKYKPIRIDKENEAGPIYKKFGPDVLLAAMSSLVLGPYVINEFVDLAHADSKKIICFQDYWANHRNPMNFKMMKYWDAVLVPDDLAKNLILQDGYEGRVIVSGNPAFDELAKIDVGKEKSRLRKKFKIPEGSFVILHCGTGTPQSWQADEITFNFIARTVRELKKQYKKLILISRPHPRDENPGRYQKMAPDLGLLDTSAFPLTEELLPMADVVVAMYSTNLIHACYLRIPAISILLPGAGKKNLERVSLPDFPPNNVGATIGVYKDSVADLAGEITKIMNDPAHRAVIQKSQTQFFPINKKSSAKKIADEIVKFLK